MPSKIIISSSDPKPTTFKLLDFLDAESLLVLHQVAPDWKPIKQFFEDIEPLKEINIIMKQRPQGSQALMVKH